MKLSIDIQSLRATKEPMRKKFREQVDNIQAQAMKRSNQTDSKTWQELYDFATSTSAVKEMYDTLGGLNDSINQLVELGCKVLADPTLKPAAYRGDFDEYVKAGNRVIFRLDSMAKDVLRDPSYEAFNVIWSRNVDDLAKMIGMDDKPKSEGKSE